MVYTDKIHLVADTLEELHSFATNIGMKREWFQNHKRHPHYDIFGIMLKKALSSGAVVISSKDLVLKANKLNCSLSDVSVSLCSKFEPRDDYSSVLCKKCGQSYLKHNEH